MYNNKLKKIAVIMVWFLVIAMVVTSFSFMIFAEEKTSPPESISTQLKDMEEVLEFIEKTYVDEVDMNLLIDGAYQGIFEQLDPYSVYYESTEGGDSFMEQAVGQFYGIGAVFTKTDAGVQIKEFLKTSTAREIGMQVGDIVLTVDQIDVRNKTTAEVAAAVRGKDTAPVNMTILRNGTEMSFRVQRMLIESESVTYKMIDETIGYVSISNFYSSTTSEFINAWNTMKANNPKLKHLIVDVRNNPGGLVSSAITMSNLFLFEGSRIMNYVRQNQVVYSYIADGNLLVDIPVTVLVNKGTGSAAEIFAGALQDNYAATIVGAPTYGKGMAQVVANLDSGAAVKLSVYYFTTPDNKVIQGQGITPSYIIYNGDNKAAINRYREMRTVAAMDEGRKYAIGQRGLNVYAAQQRLKILGYENVTLSGVLDAATAEALKKVQAEAGVYVYGALDFTTIKCLERAYQQNVFGVGEDLQLQAALKEIR